VTRVVSVIGPLKIRNLIWYQPTHTFREYWTTKEYKKCRFS
jgi:hypothetical protein